jgi:cytoskeleton protein RodZ
MTSIGETLRQERIKRKLDLEGVSLELKISPRFLEAIEDEDFDKLPGSLFTRSFVRQYARLLGLDEDEIAGELKRVLEPQGSAPFSSAVPSVVPHRGGEIPLPRVESWGSVADKPSRWSKSLPSLAMVVGVMLVCSLAYSWLQRPRRPVVMQKSVPKAAATQTARATMPNQLASPSAPPAVLATKTNSDAQAERQNAAASTTAASGTPQPNPNASVRVEMTANALVWVSVKADGKYLFSGTLQPNETKTAGGNENITIRLGNAGGIRISLNGKPIGSVGPKGQIRTVQFTSGGFQILPPEVSKPAPPIDVLDPL